MSTNIININFFANAAESGKGARKGVSSEWRLVKASIIAGSAFPVTAVKGS